MAAELSQQQQEQQQQQQQQQKQQQQQQQQQQVQQKLSDLTHTTTEAPQPFSDPHNTVVKEAASVGVHGLPGERLVEEEPIITVELSTEDQVEFSASAGPTTAQQHLLPLSLLVNETESLSSDSSSRSVGDPGECSLFIQKYNAIFSDNNTAASSDNSNR